jgi:hypothetical protein
MGTTIGLREITLLFMGAGMALFMLDLANFGVAAVWIGLSVWAWSIVHGPRPTLLMTFAYGAGAFLMTFWWQEGGWWWLAIPLLWAGVALMAGSGFLMIMRRLRKPKSMQAVQQG